MSDSPTCRAPTVVVLHGLGRTQLSMSLLVRRLRRAGLRVVWGTYPSMRRDLSALAGGWLPEFLRAHGVWDEPEVDFVTHSMGGIVVRWFDRHVRPGFARRVVMLAPPNRGSEIIDRGRRWWLFRAVQGPAALQLHTGPDSAPNQLGPGRAGFGVIAGTRSLNPVFSAIVPGPGDGKVSVERARLDGAGDFATFPYSHTWLMNRRPVQDAVLRFLARGRFEPGRRD